MPWGLSDDEYDRLVERYDEVFSDLLDYDGIPIAENAIADAAEAISDAGDDPYEVLSSLIDEREEAAEQYGQGMQVDWDTSDYDQYELDDEWFFYH